MKLLKYVYKCKIPIAFVVVSFSLLIFMLFAVKVFDLTGIKASVVNKTEYIALAEDIQISADWKEIDLTNIDFSRKDINSIHIVMDSSYNVFVGKNRGIAPPQGEIFLPQIAVEDIEGIRCDLSFSGSLGDDTASFWDIYETRCFSEAKRYKTLLVKSSSTFIAKRILWSGFNVADMK